MRRNPFMLISAVTAIALLAACGPKDEAVKENVAAEPAATADVATASAPTGATAAPTPASASAAKPATSKPAPPPSKPVTTLTVPAGTELALSLATPLSTKSAKVGDTVRATVTSDVTVDGKVAIASGTSVAGSVVKVVSGSDKIGGVPTLAIAFDRIELSGGKDLPITGEITQKGKSDNTRDTVKIVGGAAAGAILGNETIKGDKGKVIGGLLGGAAGAVAAQKTGTEVKLVEGTALSLALGAAVEITK
jgi:hypothetical protein